MDTDYTILNGTRGPEKVEYHFSHSQDNLLWISLTKVDSQENENISFLRKAVSKQLYNCV